MGLDLKRKAPSPRVFAGLCSSDQRTVMCRTLDRICSECGSARTSELSFPTPAEIKKIMKYYPVPENEKWRQGVISELLDKQLEVPGFNDNELHEVVSYLCRT